jgi:7-carboxy-7-deazaguanine synthase
MMNLLMVNKELSNEYIYYISEIFESIQGEGNYAGVYSLFLRFHFCNFTCSWCDTKYTWLEKSGKHEPYTAEQLKNMISGQRPYHVILTGGEPTLHQLDKLVVPAKKYHVESNGSIIPTEPLNITLKDGTQVTRDAMDERIICNFNWVISPKLLNSGQELNENSLAYWAEKDYCIFKFVIRESSDLDEVKGIVKQFSLDQKKIYIALEGMTLESQLKPQLVDEIIAKGFNFSPRLHTMLWGNRKGK